MNVRIVAAALLVVAPMGTSATAAFPFRTVALTGQPATGLPAGLTLSRIRPPVINEDGVIAFDAVLAGPGINYTHPSNAYTVWREQDGVLTNIVRSGEQAVGLPAGVKIYLPGSPKIDGEGRVAFLAEAPGGDAHGIFSEGQGALRLVARETDAAPGVTGGAFWIFGGPLMNNAGHVAFTAFLRGPGLPPAAESLWSDRSGTLALVIREGLPAPGIAGASILQVGSHVLNDLGVIAFQGRYTGGVYPNDTAIWTESGGNFSLIARSGQAPAALPSGGQLGFLSAPRINNAGQLLFQGTLTGTGVTTENDRALWLHDAGALELIARKGEGALGMPAGVNHGGFVYSYVNGAGEATFIGTLVGSGVTSQNDTALWSQRGDALNLIAREGDPAPGTPLGTTFGDLTRLGGGPDGFLINDKSQVAFQAPLTGIGVTNANDAGIWVTDLTGALRLIAREGDSFDVNDDPMIADLRTVKFVDLRWFNGGGEDGFASSFNNSGQLAFALNFTDFTDGAFVVETAIPEPSTVLLAGSSLFGLAAIRRRKQNPPAPLQRIVK